ncbi:hypothetical protein pdam_00002840 [Pocillopora damicornis]|uniref:Cytochrome c oxidase assembly protein COX20, mitochondrial n=1 Tax=Pocillopora damicornis TaxID=46731 RepID=A0A3M6U8Y0_POCDA|nr:hypothetical protein pdam_00002840 [Pocillopora damicornis]
MADDVFDSATTKKYNWNFKKFIERTPCARESLLYGIGAGMIAGFGCFMKTSEEVCRYIKQKEKEAIKQHVDMLNKYREQRREEEGSEE